MRRFITFFVCVLVLSTGAWAQRMSDEQVVQYVKNAQSMGKTQKQIASELMRRGVTKEQAERIQGQYGSSQAADGKDNSNADAMRTRVRTTGDQKLESIYRAKYRRSRSERMDEDSLQATTVREIYPDEGNAENQIFGHSIFTNERLTFEPNVNVSTPVNYRLGPGDEVIIDVWGASETSIRQVISPEGSIMITNLGPVYLSGKTVKEANAYLRQEFAKIYSGVVGDDPTTQIKLTLGDIRTIQVNVMGEVVVPGTYTLSSFASVFNALYNAGGVNRIGSLRSIKVVRQGNVIADIDVYGLLMSGKVKDDVRLQDGDVVLVNPYQVLAQVTGKVKRPMYYELKPSETVASLLEYAGHFTGDAYKKAVRIIRSSDRERQIFNVDDIDYSVFTISDGDVLSVESILNRFENRVEIRGAVYREGLYQINGTMNTVKELIKKAEGLRGDAFLNRGILDRENEDLTHELIQVDVRGLLNGTVADIPLQRNDVLYIPSIHDLQEEQTVTIHGAIANPGTYLFSGNMTIEDLVVQAGGLLERASAAKVEVARRMKDPKSVTFSTQIGQTFSFDLKDGFVVGKDGEQFTLEPFDEVYVRKSPAYFAQQNVTVNGEVLFSGSYALSKKNERLSDLVAKAGGITPDAYVKGARLVRKMTDEELKRQKDALRMARSGEGKDSISIDKLDISEYYTVGIELEKALQSPGSDYDLVLRENDALYIPEYINTVKISGAVMYPNTVLYKEGESLSYYINQAGGYGDMARRRKAYAIYLNGTVSRVKKYNSSKIEPGCEIIVPSKAEKQKMSTSEILSMGTSITSLAAMIATLVNVFK